MKLLFIVNPAAGGGKGLKAWREVEAVLAARGIPADHRFTEKAGGSGSAAALARQARDDYDCIVGVGGDGTLQEVANGLVGDFAARRIAEDRHSGHRRGGDRGDGDRGDGGGAGGDREGKETTADTCRAALGIIPGGTGNDFCKMLGYPKDPVGALDVVLGGSVRHFDVGIVNGNRVFINVMGVGFDAEVAGFLNKSPKRLPGLLMYLYGILVILMRFRPALVRVRMDDDLVTQKCLLVSVGNGHSHAGGLQMCPEAKPDDGILDVLLAGDLGRGETLALLPKLPSGRHTTHPKVSIRRARKVTIESDEPLVVQADGEILGEVPATIEVAPRVLRVVGRPVGGQGGE